MRAKKGDCRITVSFTGWWNRLFMSVELINVHIRKKGSTSNAFLKFQPPFKWLVSSITKQQESGNGCCISQGKFKPVKANTYTWRRGVWAYEEMILCRLENARRVSEYWIGCCRGWIGWVTETETISSSNQVGDILKLGTALPIVVIGVQNWRYGFIGANSFEFRRRYCPQFAYLGIRWNCLATACGCAIAGLLVCGARIATICVIVGIGWCRRWVLLLLLMLLLDLTGFCSTIFKPDLKI